MAYKPPQPGEYKPVGPGAKQIAFRIKRLLERCRADFAQAADLTYDFLEIEKEHGDYPAAYLRAVLSCSDRHIKRLKAFGHIRCILHNAGFERRQLPASERILRPLTELLDDPQQLTEVFSETAKAAADSESPIRMVDILRNVNDRRDPLGPLSHSHSGMNVDPQEIAAASLVRRMQGVIAFAEKIEVPAELRFKLRESARAIDDWRKKREGPPSGPLR